VLQAWHPHVVLNSAGREAWPQRVHRGALQQPIAEVLVGEVETD